MYHFALQICEYACIYNVTTTYSNQIEINILFSSDTLSQCQYT